MKIRRISLLVAAALVLATAAMTVARAQSAPSTVADFTVKSVANANVQLSSFADRKAVVVVFFSPSCPFSRLYQDRLSALAGQYASQGVQFLLLETPINLDASTAEADKLKIKSDGGNNLTYLRDETAAVATQLGATKTPEAVVLQPSGNTFTVRYRGAIDDNPQMEAYAKQHYLRQALENVLAGRPAGVAAQRAAGCLIRKN